MMISVKSMEKKRDRESPAEQKQGETDSVCMRERQRESSRAEAGRDRQCLYERETERFQQRGETDSVCMRERRRESSRAEAGRDRQCLYERETERVQQSRSRERQTVSV